MLDLGRLSEEVEELLARADYDDLPADFFRDCFDRHRLSAQA
jgi:hypothetical protein